MEIKRPFSEADWLATPKPVRDYVEFLEQKVIELAGLVERLQANQIKLAKRIDELESRLNQNSQNSSKPPSSDPPYRKPGKDEAAKPKMEKRKKGGQKGHKGHRQELLEPNRVVALRPEACSCGNCHFPSTRMEPFYTHQVIELPEIKMDVTHFVLHRIKCAKCGRTVKAELPTHIRYAYGPGLTALIAEMSGVMGCSRETVRNFCSSAFSFNISTGSIQNVIDRASAAIEPIYNEIGRQVRLAPVNHVDETSFFQGGNLQWLWVLLNAQMAFFMIHAHRSKAAFQELIRNWKGILICDDYGVYRKWAEKKQACLAHLIRRAIGLTEQKDKQLKAFGEKALTELRLLCHWAKAPPTIDEELQWITRFVGLISEHAKQDDKAGKFARQLARQLESLWLFLDEQGVEPTNNRAERALRFAVLWRKRSNGTQSEKGDRWVERILSVKETCRLRSVSTFKILTDSINSFFKEQKSNLNWLTQT